MMLPLVPWACMARTSCFMLRPRSRNVWSSKVSAKLSAVWLVVIGPTRTFGGELFHCDIETAQPRDCLVDRWRGTSSPCETSALMNSIGRLMNLGLGNSNGGSSVRAPLRPHPPTGNHHPLSPWFGEGDGWRRDRSRSSAVDQYDLVTHLLILSICCLPAEYGKANR